MAWLACATILPGGVQMEDAGEGGMSLEMRRKVCR
jgi:hypothetical protein